MKEFGKFYDWYLRYFCSKEEETATTYDKYIALCNVVRAHIADDWRATQRYNKEDNRRRVYYLSLDYNFGQSLSRHIIDAGIESDIENATDMLKESFDTIAACEPEFELGNPPKGGMAQCVQETLASQAIPAMGYGLWYEYARFRQLLHDGTQVEAPYNWKVLHHPWTISRPEYAFTVPFGGTLSCKDEDDTNSLQWCPDEFVMATPLDYPVVGYKNGVVNTVRFWDAVPAGEFRSDYLNHGDYVRACDEKANSVNMTRYLFPDERITQTTEVRIKQQYFLVTASLHDIVRRYLVSNPDIRNIHEKVVIHFVDSRCAIAIIEMLRILIYEHDVAFEDAFTITKKLFLFSTMSLTYDDFEKWPLYLVESILPLHVKIIYDLNHAILTHPQLLKELSDDVARDISLIEEGPVRKIRLANIAVLMSRGVSGVSDYQIDLLRNTVFKKITEAFKIDFITGLSGISVRRWLIVPNPELVQLISSCIGASWLGDNRELLKFYNYSSSSNIRNRFEAIKQNSRNRLMKSLPGLLKIPLTSDNLLVVQARRIHLGCRQTLQLLYIVHRYLRLLKGEDLVPRTYLFAGRASPNDFLGKQLVHLINIIAGLVNANEETIAKLQVYFLPNLSATMEEHILPATDLVEQPTAYGIDVAGFSILKYTVNGAIPVVGENPPDLEIAALLGNEHIFRFGQKENYENYDPNAVIDNDPDLCNVFRFIEEEGTRVSGGSTVSPLLSSLRHNDEYGVMNVFKEYCLMQDSIDVLFCDRDLWNDWTLKNIARSGLGSLDGVINSFYYKTLTE